MQRSLRAVSAAFLAVVASWLLPAGAALAQHGDGPEPAAAHSEAAAGGHEKVGVIPSVTQGAASAITALVVFALVLAILSRTVWPKIVKGLEDRERKIRDEIAAAEQARLQARNALEQYEKSLADARTESQRMLEQTRAQQQALAAELKAKAEVELGQMRERALKDIDQARRTAVAELYAGAADLATMAAGKILKREVNASDTRRLLEESLNQLQGTGR